MGRPKNKRDLMRVSLHLPKDHYQLMAKIGEEEDLSVAQMVRRAVELYLVTQFDMLGISESDLALASHVSETRSKRATIVTRATSLERMYSDNTVEELFKDLNPAAFT
ncbi:hypothetical protein [Planktothrix sp.]|uniref:hypothetical protein n=1 Tax=Planktothrix sp. TaxID=3088171 RepID=UPI0038D35531